MLKFPRAPDLTRHHEQHPALGLLQRAHPFEQALSIFDDKVKKKPLLLRPSSPNPDSQNARESRRTKRLQKREHYLRHRKPRPLSAKERRKQGVHDIPTDELSRKWNTYLPLRRLWWGYIQEILDIKPEEQESRKGTSFVTGASAGPKLAAADFHGAELEVVRSRCVSRVGVKGIVLKDTKFTFEMITPDNEVKIIPKAHTVFRFEVPRVLESRPISTKDDKPQSLDDTGGNEGLKPFVFEIHGNQFEARPADRANKKFKNKKFDDL